MKENLDFLIKAITHILYLTSEVPITTAADDCFFFSIYLFFFFKENKSSHFMWIICQADDSQDMSRLISSEK